MRSAQKKQAKKAWKWRIEDLLSRAHYSNLQKQINQKKTQMPCRGSIITHSVQNNAGKKGLEISYRRLIIMRSAQKKNEKRAWKCCIECLLSRAHDSNL